MNSDDPDAHIAGRAEASAIAHQGAFGKIARVLLRLEQEQVAKLIELSHTCL
jgi:hypothetical protein